MRSAGNNPELLLLGLSAIVKGLGVFATDVRVGLAMNKKCGLMNRENIPFNHENSGMKPDSRQLNAPIGKKIHDPFR